MLKTVLNFIIFKGGFDLNKVGVVGVVLALIGLFLPWWEINLSVCETVNSWVTGNREATIWWSAGISVYPYQITKNSPTLRAIAIRIIPFLYFVLPLIVIGILLGVAGCITGDEKKEEILLILAGSLTLFSTIMFIFVLQVELLVAPPAIHFFGLMHAVPIPKVGIFSNGGSTFEGTSLYYSSYLSIGFWLTVIAAAVILYASRKHA